VGIYGGYIKYRLYDLELAFAHRGNFVITNLFQNKRAHSCDGNWICQFGEWHLGDPGRQFDSEY
jgi:hypothetical protein